MPTIMPIRDLRNTSEISELAHRIQEPIFITKNGYSDLVVMSIETYEALLGTADIDSGITSAEAEISAGGELIDAEEALKELRRKYFG